MVPDKIEFAIDGDTYLPEVKGPSPDDASQEIVLRDREPFGAEYGGAIIIRWPRHDDLRIRIPSLVTAALLEAGAREPDKVPWPTYRFTEAVTFFSVLGVTVPPWLTGAVDYSTKGETAILRAYEVATGRIAESKKPGGATSASSSIAA